jgi:O-antigen/teichoic acid export membrane protein/glycosyltransferase involved in cell wall biosynthesis
MREDVSADHSVPGGRAPRVSVVLPAREADPALLGLALRSILDQDMTDLEVLLVEAGPVALAARVVLELGDDRVVHVHLPGARSLGEQLNEGLRRARADLVARMDADDVSHATRLGTQVRFLADHPDVDVVGCQLRIIDEAGAPCGRRTYPTSHEAILAAMPRYNPIAHPAAVLRRDVVLAHGGYAEDDAPAQDYDLWSRLAHAGRRFANLPEALLDYRVHPGSVKARHLRRTLHATLDIKRRHWLADMSWSARLRLAVERAALVAPPALVLAAFRLVEHSLPGIDRDVRREIGHSTVLLAGSLAAALMGFAYVAHAVTRLGPALAAEFEAAVFVIMSLTALLHPVDSVVARAVTQLRARGDGAGVAGLRAHVLRRVVAAVVVSTLLAAPAAAWAAGPLGLGTGASLALAMGTAGLLVVVGVDRGVLRGQHRFGAYAAGMVAEAALRVCVGVALLARWRSAPVAVSAHAASAAAALVVTAWQVRGLRRVPPGPGRPEVSLLRFGAPMLVLAAADAAYTAVDPLFVKACFPDAEAGLYGAVALLTRTLGVLVTPFVVLLLPLLASRLAEGKGAGPALLRVVAYFTVLSAPPVLLFALWPGEILASLYDARFAPGAPLVLPHALGLLAGYLAMLLGQAFAAVGRFSFLWIHVLGVVVEASALAAWARDLQAVVQVVVVTKVAVLAALAVTWLASARGPRRGAAGRAVA